MKKIPTIFQRNYEGDRLVRNEVVPGCEWVLNGEGVATVKFDGTCCMVKDGVLFKRYDAKNGKTPPSSFIPAQEPDMVTGHWPGWVPVDKNNPADKWIAAAWEFFLSPRESVLRISRDGTYEVCGPHFNGNPEGLQRDTFIRHGMNEIVDAPRTFEGLRNFLSCHYIEGIVFHRAINENGDMAKIKRTDFGFEWNKRTAKR